LANAPGFTANLSASYAGLRQPGRATVNPFFLPEHAALSVAMLTRATILPEPDLPEAAELLEAGRRLARDWNVGPCPFLSSHQVACEAEFKRNSAASHHLMQHAQIGWRDAEKSRHGWAKIYESCAAKGVTIDRYGICLDWSMGVKRASRRDALCGTGLILHEPADFVRLTQAAPVAPHFGDFVLGFPAAVENTCSALAAGATVIGNLGQYFTFRLHGFDDDTECTSATLVALGLIAAQPVEVLVHSNLDDGFAAMFRDLGSVIGAALLEQHIGRLCSVEVSHCWGHHFSDPVRRLAFHLALSEISNAPGTMVYGNTTSYRGTRDENFAALAGYLAIDIAGQLLKPSGHAINAVPVSENERIPDTQEVIEAQLFAARLTALERRKLQLLDAAPAEQLAKRLITSGRRFHKRAMKGLAKAGIDTSNPFELLLAIRRLGGRQMEQMFGEKTPAVTSDIAVEIEETATVCLDRIASGALKKLIKIAPRVVTATTDVHEHGKMVLDKVLRQAGAELIDGGTSVPARELAELATKERADAIAISTYNGIALSYYKDLQDHVGKSIPVLVGGRLNQIPEAYNTALPVDVSDELAAAGAIVCEKIEDAIPALLQQMEARK
jgi:methylmalonyl-CoA mutase cobalamin-binding subunit